MSDCEWTCNFCVGVVEQGDRFDHLRTCVAAEQAGAKPAEEHRAFVAANPDYLRFAFFAAAEAAESRRVHAARCADLDVLLRDGRAQGHFAAARLVGSPLGRGKPD